MKPAHHHRAGHRRATLSIRQTAWLLGVPLATVHRAIRVGIIRTVNGPHGLVVRESDVIRLMRGGAE
jgi:predicted site-specific integrase-resolvase